MHLGWGNKSFILSPKEIKGEINVGVAGGGRLEQEMAERKGTFVRRDTSIRERLKGGLIFGAKGCQTREKESLERLKRNAGESKKSRTKEVLVEKKVGSSHMGREKGIYQRGVFVICANNGKKQTKVAKWQKVRKKDGQDN